MTRGRYLHEFHAKGRNGQCLLYSDCPDPIPENFQAEATHNDSAGLVAALGQHPGPHSHHCGGLIGGKGGEDGPPPTLFAGSHPSGLFPLPESESQAGWPDIDTETFKNSWEGVVRSIAKEDFAAAFRPWKERCEECICVGGNYVEK